MSAPSTGPVETRVRVLTVDDHPVFRKAARDLLRSTLGFELAGEATSGAEALAEAERLAPDLVLLDVRMPGMDGIETAGRLRDAHPGIVVVLVTGGDAESVRPLAEASGATALVPKESLTPTLLRRLWAAHGGC